MSGKHQPEYYARLLVDRVPSMLAYWDRGLQCRFANRAYERWFGIDPDWLIGRTLKELLGAELFAANEPHIRAALAGQEQVFERIVPGPDGVLRHSLARYIPDRVDGEVLGFLVEVTEITELKQVRQALQLEQEMRQEIERQMHRVAQLAGQRSEMLNAFAHEVRQPINNASAALQSALAALAQIPAAAPAAERVQRASAVLSRVQAAVDNTLADAVLLGGEQPLTRQDVELDTLLQLARGDLDPFDQRRVRLDRLTAARTASLNTGLMRLALRNLLINALRYARADTPIEVSVQDADDGNALLIDVRDQGPGFAAEMLPRLFTRSPNAPSASHPGSHGLGLYIVRRVMELHGGSATLAANGPDGACIRLHLP